MAKISNSHDAKAAYADELHKLQMYLNTLQASVAAARGDGNLSDKIHWGHVGDLSHLNSILEEALQVPLARIQ